MAADDLLNALARAGLYDLLRLRLVQPIPVATPAVGAEWTKRVPAGVFWELLVAGAAFVTSAVVANRVPRVQLADGDGAIVTRLNSGISVVASQTTRVDAAAGTGAAIGTGGVGVAMPTPALLALPGWTLSSSTLAIDVGDAYSGIVLTVREWSAQQVAAQAKWIGRQLPPTIFLDEGG